MTNRPIFTPNEGYPFSNTSLPYAPMLFISLIGPKSSVDNAVALSILLPWS
jgi:hypothetical protein